MLVGFWSGRKYGYYYVCGCVYSPNVGQSHNVAKFKCLETAVTDQNFIHEEIRKIKFEECLLPFCSESLVFSSRL